MRAFCHLEDVMMFDFDLLSNLEPISSTLMLAAHDMP